MDLKSGGKLHQTRTPVYLCSRITGITSDMEMLFHIVLLLHIFLIKCTAYVIPNVYLKGTGASFPEDLFSKWISGYRMTRQQFVRLTITYSTRDSAAGFSYMERPDRRHQFGAMEVPVTQQYLDQHPSLVQVPLVAGALALGYNVPGLTNLTLTEDAVVGIYNGSIAWWNDTRIQEVNAQTMPRQEIRVVARTDWSGGTHMFTEGLSSFSQQWNATFGTFVNGTRATASEEMDPDIWDPTVIDYYGRYDRGMLGLIFSYFYSIGYMSVAQAVKLEFPYANLINDGLRTSVSTMDTRHVMMDNYHDMDLATLTGSLVNSALPGVYPLLGYSYVLLERNSDNCTEAVELYRFLEWIYYDLEAASEAAELLCTQVIADVSNQVFTKVLNELTCEDGYNVYQLVESQKAEEAAILRRPLVIGLAVGITCGLFLFGAIIAYLIHQQLRLRRALAGNEWCIPVEEIKIRWDKEGGWMSQKELRSSFGSQWTQNQPSGGTSIASSGGANGWSLYVSKLGRWKDASICLRRFPKSNFIITKTNTKRAILEMRDLIHTNVLRFYAVTLLEGEYYLVSDFAKKGTLSDVLQNSRYKLDDTIKFAMAMDVASGMDYLHNHHLVHGNLSSDACLLDSRWNVLITNWELLRMYTEERERKISRVEPLQTEECTDENMKARLNLWTAPEILTAVVDRPDRRTDMYSYGVLMVEVFTREDPYSELSDLMEPVQILDMIVTTGLRPDIDQVEVGKVKPLIVQAWHEDPDARPSFPAAIKKLKRARPSHKSVIESMMETLEEYVLHLEEKVTERTEELAHVNSSLENLLNQLLPPTVARALSRGEPVEPEAFDCVTIYFSDIVGFTTICSTSTPMEVVGMLNDLYTAFDHIVDKLDVYKVETIGDAYMCISGLPIRNGDEHVANIATMGLKMMAVVNDFKLKHKPREKLRIRSGIHTGPVVAGIVGIKMPRYCLFGDTVNTSSRMESTSISMNLQISQTTHNLLSKRSEYTLQYRGEMEVKGKGKMKTYFLIKKEGEAFVANPGET